MADIKTIESPLNDFEEKIKRIKAKHLSRDFDSEKKQTDLESELQRRQTLLVNPKLKDIVNLFDDEFTKEDKGHKNTAHQNNMLINGVNKIPMNFTNTKKIDSAMKEFSKTQAFENRAKSPLDKWQQSEVKDKINALKLSMLNGREESTTANYRYESIKAKDRVHLPTKPSKPIRVDNNTFKDDFKATVDKFNKISSKTIRFVKGYNNSSPIKSRKFYLT
jgi:hypothetical protein